eukprot:2362407-Pyramimonas_sp.AAC.1
MRDGTRVPRLRVQRSHSDSISNGLWKSDTLEFKVAIKVAGSQSKRNPGIDSTSQVAIRPCEQPGVWIPSQCGPWSDGFNYSPSCL